MVTEGDDSDKVVGLWAWVVVVACAAPHHSPVRQLREADGTFQGGGSSQAQAGIVSRGRRGASVFEEDCDERKRLLTSPRKRKAQQAASGKPNKREALEVNIGTGILVQGGTTPPPFRNPQNPAFSPAQPGTTHRPIIFPDSGPQNTPSPSVTRPSQSPPTIFHNPFFPGDLFPSPGSRPNPTGGRFPSITTPRLTRPSSNFPGQTTPNYLFPDLLSQRPSFPDTLSQRPNSPYPPNLGPDYVHPTTHRPKFPGFPIPTSPTTRRPCSCRNLTAVTTPSPNLLSPSPLRPLVTPVPRPFPSPTPGVLRPATPSPEGFGPTLRPRFNSVAGFPFYPSTHLRPVYFLHYLGPPEVIINSGPQSSNVLLPRFSPGNRQRFAAPRPFRAYYISQPRNPSFQGLNQLDETKK